MKHGRSISLDIILALRGRNRCVGRCDPPAVRAIECRPFPRPIHAPPLLLWQRSVRHDSHMAHLSPCRSKRRQWQKHYTFNQRRDWKSHTSDSRDGGRLLDINAECSRKLPWRGASSLERATLEGWHRGASPDAQPSRVPIATPRCPASLASRSCAIGAIATPLSILPARV